MSAHTPGPWFIDPDGFIGDMPDLAIDASGGQVALACGDSNDETLANARLIAAAPELLEMLSVSLELLRKVDPSGDPESDSLLKETIEVGVAIIAKATGAKP